MTGAMLPDHPGNIVTDLFSFDHIFITKQSMQIFLRIYANQEKMFFFASK